MLSDNNSLRSVGRHPGVRYVSESGNMLWRITWGQEMMCASGVFLRRWVIETPILGFRIHHWLRSDDSRAMHDHPWWFISCVLYGSYTEMTESGEAKVRAFAPHYHHAKYRHRVVVDKSCWSFLITGPRSNDWGFWLNGKFVRAITYLKTYGRHACE